MNSSEKLNFRQLQKLVAFKKANEEALKLNPLLWLMLEDAEGFYNRIADLMVKDEKSSKALTQEKEVIFESLTADSVVTNDMLISYGNYKKFIPFMSIQGCSKTDLKRARDEDVISNVQSMIAEIEAHPTESVEAGVSEERKLALIAKVDEAIAVVHGPEKFRLEQHDVNVQIDAELEGYRKLLNDSIKPNMRANYADSNPDLYKAFLNAIHTDTLPKKTKVITGSFKNEKGEPVSDVWIQLDEEKPVKKGGKKGQFYFYNVAAGQHSLVFTKESYKQEKRVFMLEADHCMHFDITFILEEVQVESETEA
ncbi:hypothetical protein [Marinifilum fragile]|uniref:hypothetical protein n=1 Tax=Marinifilum fragile TaxID=570161 RepID=UPI002AAA914B|nr:hypothetical protein [Marinifilum fragile]